MSDTIRKELEKLAQNGEHARIIARVERLAEQEIDLDILERYVRALYRQDNFTGALEVLMALGARFAGTAKWSLFLGQAYFNLGRVKEAQKALLEGQKLAESDPKTLELIKGLLTSLGPNVLRDSLAPTPNRQRPAYYPHIKGAPYFENFDWDSFWDSRLLVSLAEFDGDPLTEEMIVETENELAFKLPEGYKAFLRRKNGGVPRYRTFHLPPPPEREDSARQLVGLLGLDSRRKYSLLGSRGSRFMYAKYGFPQIGLIIGHCLAPETEAIYLDYSDRGANGEPHVSYCNLATQELVWLAGDFESFIINLSQAEPQGQLSLDWEIEPYEDFVDLVENAGKCVIFFHPRRWTPLRLSKLTRNSRGGGPELDGHNWTLFFLSYLEKYAEDLTVDLKSDSTAAFCLLYYDLTPENQVKARRVYDMIQRLLRNPKEVFLFLRSDGQDIKWAK
ncbi:MAG: immunity 51 family protein [Deltaproteobacteria bacterium]|jgi:hypothetical protein|nr:immunity 51 family protein [Deltaproteobacteria bacterium]